MEASIKSLRIIVTGVQVMEVWLMLGLKVA
jgi:hypothetical protein